MSELTCKDEILANCVLKPKNHDDAVHNQALRFAARIAERYDNDIKELKRDNGRMLMFIRANHKEDEYKAMLDVKPFLQVDVQ